MALRKGTIKSGDRNLGWVAENKGHLHAALLAGASWTLARGRKGVQREEVVGLVEEYFFNKHNSPRQVRTRRLPRRKSKLQSVVNERGQTLLHSMLGNTAQCYER